MKREFLEGLDLGEGVTMPKSAVDAIMAENGRDIEAQKTTITTLTTERDGLRTQLEAANTTIQSYKDMDIDGIKKSAADWETKYNTDTQKLKDNLVIADMGGIVSEVELQQAQKIKAAQALFKDTFINGDSPPTPTPSTAWRRPWRAAPPSSTLTAPWTGRTGSIWPVPWRAGATIPLHKTGYDRAQLSCARFFSTSTITQ